MCFLTTITFVQSLAARVDDVARVDGTDVDVWAVVPAQALHALRCSLLRPELLTRHLRARLLLLQGPEGEPLVCQVTLIILKHLYVRLTLQSNIVPVFWYRNYVLFSLNNVNHSVGEVVKITCDLNQVNHSVGEVLNYK